MRSKSKDFFESIGEFSHNIGIYLTYTLDIEVIDKLTEYASGSILILHDYTQGKNIEENRDSGIICLPIKTLVPNQENCFHSKLVLLKSEDCAKLIIGSVNLSTDSFSSEKEIAFEKELDFGKPTDVCVYNKVLLFLESLGEQIPVYSNILKDTLGKLKYKSLPEKSSDIEFVYNSSEASIFDHLNGFIKKQFKEEKAKNIKIATPFTSDQYTAIEDFKKISSNISVYLRTGTKIDAFTKNQFKIFQPAGKKREGFHAKLVLIEFVSESLLFIGSANFTEQGFFQNTSQSANQECGIILKVPKNELNDWFDEKHWKQIVDIESYTETTDNSTEWKESENECYACAIKEGDKIITHIYNPQKWPIKQDDRKIKMQSVDEKLFLYKTDNLKINDKEQNTIKFKIGDNEIKIAVFEFELFNAASNQRNESIFAFFRGIYSLNPKEVDEEIDKDKISTHIKINITEPPKLEQYFYNIKNLIQHIKHKKYFSEYNEKEIRDEIENANGGRGMYLALQLLKLINGKSNTENLSLICKNRVDELSVELNIDKQRLNKFLKEWLTSKT